MAFLQDALNTMGDALSGSSTVKSTTTSTQSPIAQGSSKAPLIIGVSAGVIALIVVILSLKKK